MFLQLIFTLPHFIIALSLTCILLAISSGHDEEAASSGDDGATRCVHGGVVGCGHDGVAGRGPDGGAVRNMP